MSMNPSNQIAARMNPGCTMFPNLAGGHRDGLNETDRIVKAELDAAGISAHGPADWLRTKGEVPDGYLGELCMWGFRRAWYYWIAEGPGVPPDIAEEFHRTWGRQVRVCGHCGCPSPLEFMHGFAVGLYHIDTQEGLTAFAQLLRDVYIETGKGKEE